MKDNFNHDMKLNSLKSGNEELSLLIGLQSIKLLQNLNNQLNSQRKEFFQARVMNFDNCRNSNKELNNLTVYSQNPISNFIFEKSPSITDNFYFEDPAKISMKHTISTLGGCNINIFNDNNNINLTAQLKSNSKNSFLRAKANESSGKTITNSSIHSINKGKLSETFNVNNFFLYSPSTTNSFFKRSDTRRTEISDNANESNLNYFYSQNENEFLGKKIKMNLSMNSSKNNTLNEIHLKSNDKKESYPTALGESSSVISYLPQNQNYLFNSITEKKSRTKYSKIKKQNLKLSCAHEGCDFDFKTTKQKITHHNKFENECKADKISIIKLIFQYKQTILKLTKNKAGQSEENLKFLEVLKNEFESTKSRLIDCDYFNATAGDNFEDFP